MPAAMDPITTAHRNRIDALEDEVKALKAMLTEGAHTAVDALHERVVALETAVGSKPADTGSPAIADQLKGNDEHA